MGVTLYTFIMGILFLNVFIFLVHSLRKNERFIKYVGIELLLIISIGSLARLFVPLEFSYTKVIGSSFIYPLVVSALEANVWYSKWNEISMMFALLCISLSVSSILMLIKILEVRKINKLINNLPSVANEHTISLFHHIVNTYNMKKSPRLIQTSAVSIPRIIGIKKSIVLLPDIEFNDEELALILKHELNHIVKKDLLIKYIIDIICILLWWNPMIYILKKDISQILEIRSDFIVCDDVSNEMRMKYLESILLISKHNAKESNIAFANNYTLSILGKNKSSLPQRFHLILDYSGKKASKIMSVVVSCIIFAVFMSSYSFVIQPSYEPKYESGSENIVNINSDNSYIIANDNSYELYINNEFATVIDENVLKDMQKYGVQIIMKGEKNYVKNEKNSVVGNGKCYGDGNEYGRVGK